MPVLDTTTGQFVDIRSDGSVPYAILSHTWDAGGKQSYQDVRRIQESSDLRPRALLRKAMLAFLWVLFLVMSTILHLLASVSRSGHLTCSPFLRLRDSTRERVAAQLRFWSYSLRETAHGLSLRFSVLNDLRLSERNWGACAIAIAENLRFLWIDSSCIDKTSSSELSEAINSMCAWYRNAVVCYAYLVDVPWAEDLRSEVILLSREWRLVGSKRSLASLVEEITGIYQDILTGGRSLDIISVSRHMSWPSRRSTTRIEDQAYSLLSIFDIVLTPIYGEGDRAFRRLQEEILRHIPDESIFAWESTPFPDDRILGFTSFKGSFSPPRYWCSYSRIPGTFLPPSPYAFRNSRDIHGVEYSRLLYNFAAFQIPLDRYNLPRKSYGSSPYGISSSHSSAERPDTSASHSKRLEPRS